MVQISKLLAVATALLAAPAVAHPGEKHDPHVVKREIHAREALAAAAKRSLGGCENSLHARQLAKRNIARRSRAVQKLRQKRGVTANPQKWRRDQAALEKWEAVNHNRTAILDYSPATPESIIFGANTSCILTPTITNGPYYVWGEIMRENVKEAQYSDGVDVSLEVQYIDINTCLPVRGALVDIWQANATVASRSQETMLLGDGIRPICAISSKPIVTVWSTSRRSSPAITKGRATHTHLLTHLNATLLPNKTLEVGTGSVTHIGQLFWNEVLRSAVEKMYPYNTNTQNVTTNAEDMWSVKQADSAYDPFPEYIYLGDGLDDGLFAWIQIGINATADYTDNSYYSIAAYHDANGGHQNSDSVAMGGAPSGSRTAMPSAPSS